MVKWIDQWSVVKKLTSGQTADWQPELPVLHAAPSQRRHAQSLLCQSKAAV
jgi:hypothetical protein